jgi:hypothetical protein
VQTLEGRITGLLTQMLGRCIQRAASQEQSSREKALRLIMGRDRLRKVVQLVKDIKRYQNAPVPKQMTPVLLSNVRSLAPSNMPKLDKPVRDLFLNTPIVNALELTPTECLNNVPWDELIQQGYQVVANYRVWVKTAKEEASANLLTNSNIQALEQELESTAADIIETFAGIQ